MRKTPILSMAIAVAAVVALPSSDRAHAADGVALLSAATPAGDRSADERDRKDDRGEKKEQAKEAQELVKEAVAVARKLDADPEIQELLRQAKGVFILPEFGKGALVVGGRGGEGVLLARHDGGWSDPAFYDLAGVSLGAQAGGSAGEMALVLMSDEAVEHFKDDTSFALNADADLTIVDYSAVAQGSVGRGDVVVWSDAEGVFAGAGFSVTGISWDEEENRAYYGPDVTAAKVLEGETKSKKGDVLRRELPT